MKTKYYITAGNFNYYEADTLEEAKAKAKQMQLDDVNLQAFYLKKYGYIPENVDIHPEGYFITTNRHN